MRHFPCHFCGKSPKLRHIVISILSIVIGFVDKWEGVTTYFLLSGLAWGIFLIRRGMRLRLDKTTSTQKVK